MLGLLLAVVVAATVWASIALSGPFIWGSLTVIAVTSIVAVVWYRRAQAERSRPRRRTVVRGRAPPLERPQRSRADRERRMMRPRDPDTEWEFFRTVGKTLRVDESDEER